MDVLAQGEDPFWVCITELQEQNSTEQNGEAELEGRQLRSTKRPRSDSTDSGNEYDNVVSPTKIICQRRSDSVGLSPSMDTIRPQEMRAFFRLTDDPVILKFLHMDTCMKVSDKDGTKGERKRTAKLNEPTSLNPFLHQTDSEYLLAMVFTYFKRADFKLREYNRRNFFLALYLACDMEEDEDYKHEIFPWALGYNWTKHYMTFLKRRDKLWARLDFRAAVSRQCCDEIITYEPDHLMWKRERPCHHAGAIRVYPKPEDEDSEDWYPRGPDASPVKCSQCDALRVDDSVSSENESWYLSSSSESSPDVVSQPVCRSIRVVPGSWLNMEALRNTLVAAED